MNKFKDDLLKENIILTDEMLHSFSIYYDLLVEENTKYNLTRITTKEEAYYLHFFDSLSVSKGIDFSKDNINILDIGSGPGFPGIPLKIAFPQIKLTIVEATNKKVLFMKKVCETLKLDDVRIFHSRAEGFKEYNKYDYVTLRAVSSIKEQIPYTIPFLKKDGKVISMKGKKKDEELEDAKNTLIKYNSIVDSIINYNVLDREYSLVIIKRNK